jgi:H+/Cl- antiporter ClcA
MAAGKMMDNGILSSISGYRERGAFLAGCLNAPSSGNAWIVVYSGQFGLIVPVPVVCAVSVMTTYHLFGQDIFTKTYDKTIDIASANL